MRSLRLPIPPEEIGDSTPLFGEGLGLDSIDVLELVLELERSFGVSITDEQTGTQVLRSVDAIADFIAAERSKRPRREPAMTGLPALRRPLPQAGPRSARANAFTVDVEEWFHICGPSPAWPIGALAGAALARREHHPPAARRPEPDRHARDVLRPRLGRRAAPRAGRRDRGGRARGRLARPPAHARLRARSGSASGTICGAASTRSLPPARRRCARSARPSGRSTSDRCGRSRCWRPKASRSMRAWRRSSWSGTSAIRAIRTRARRRPGRSSRCRRSSSIGSDRSMPLGWGWGLRMSSPRGCCGRSKRPTGPGRRRY